MVATVKTEMKWLILGANGQLGRALQKELSLREVDFRAFGHLELDISDQNAISDALGGERPSVVVNAAAWTNVDLAEEMESEAVLANTLGPAILAEESSKIGARFVHISTDYVFSGDGKEPWAESDLPAPESAYGRTKRDGESLIIQTSASNSYIVRTAWLYSEWGKNFVKTMLKYETSGAQSINVVTDQIGQPTYATDLARQIYEMIKLGARPGIYHGTNSGQTSWFEFAREIFSNIGADPTRIKPVDSSFFPRAAKRPSYSVLGHQHWLDEGISPMRDWKLALGEALTVILSETGMER